ncbi:GTP 3',8-cyclase MoaA [Pontibacillus litoralis]|uniref:GTP 3',8-cyclase n=1 Tax=Pontibacillus litoralis JSM 072002 TaxID=1385512 RepID=A0A0A5G1D3_9BACI|nr:GTP 3',8-cyclase MoaA [Pontibacillus litoralis]KGX86911.1 molybdenum cofactor biosynthesis protein A [Pontibacillus litoralis JSM 072002]
MQQQIYDQLGRPLRDLRISVIDQCNLRCTYCMPAEMFDHNYRFLQPEALLSFDEIEQLVTIFASVGVEKIRLTGGEPLLRKDIDVLIARLKAIQGIHDIALTTNGLMLPKYAKKLKEAGLHRINLSLDAINDEVFQAINGRDVKTAPVLKGLDAASKAGLKVKVNMVVKRGMNEQQVVPMARHFKNTGHILRFIEFMDVGNVNGWGESSVVSKQEIYNMLSEYMPLEALKPNYYGEVASRFRYQDGGGEIGIISSVTDHFCHTCTRARLSADGTLYHCLFASDGYSLKDLLREGTTSYEMKQHIMNKWNNRSNQYSALRAHQEEKKPNKIEMSYIGG